jgi:homoserine dehydrogenase
MKGVKPDEEANMDGATMDAPVVLSGYGPVGQQFAAYLAARGGELADAYGVRLWTAAVRASTAEIRLRPDESVPDRVRWESSPPVAESLEATGARVLVQAIPSSPALREYAAQEALVALDRGVHVVTATKVHLLSHWARLDAAARRTGAMIRISGATGAALPGGDLARIGVRGLDCDAIRACPNGTVTYVLDRLAEGSSLEEAVAEAQRRGIAEADPSADLTGSDSATKARLLAALLWGWDPAVIQVEADAVDADTAAAAAAVSKAGRRLRAVASARREDPLRVRVRLEATEAGDPLHALAGPEKAIVFGCRDAGDIVVSGGRSSPIGAALSMVKDTIDVTARRGGFR